MERKYFLVDAKNRVLGRMATRIAIVLRGKHKPIFSPDKDTGDIVVVINAKDIKLTGRKAEQKTYFSHSGYPSGDKHFPYARMLKEKPCEIIERAVNGMLPHNRLQKKMMSHLKVFAGPEHNITRKLEILNMEKQSR